MRILVLSDLWLPFPGGAERLIFNLSRALYQRGHDVLVLTGYEHAEPFDGPPVVVNLDMPTDRTGEAQVALVAARFEPELILTHHVYARGFAGLLAEWPIPVVQVVLNGPRLPFAALAVYISEWVRSRHDDARPDDLTILPPALPDVVADEHGDAIGFVKPIEHKGAQFFYRIARALPDRRFVVLRGEWQDLEIIERLPNVEFLEPVSDIRKFWELVRVVLAPSLSEDAGTIGQEAAVNGVPCLSSMAGGLPETNGGGILLPPTRVGRWVRAIRSLDNPARYESVVQRQRDYYDALDLTTRLEAFVTAVEGLSWIRS